MSAKNLDGLIEQIAALPRRLEDAVGELNKEQLDTPYGKDKWTIRQVVHHLADAHLHAFARMKSVLTEENPELTVYDQSQYALLPDACVAPIPPSLLILTGLHQRWVILLRAVREKEWSRTGRHFRRGVMTLEQMLLHYVSHGETHLGQITSLREERGW